MLYSEKVMDHFRNPRNVGEIENADGVGEVGNAKCGDIMKMYLKIDDGIICDVKFETFGCGSAIATSSIATEMIKGKPVEEALQLSNKAVVEALDGLPAYKLHCSVLAEEAVKAAVKDYYDKNGIAYDPAMFAEAGLAEPSDNWTWDEWKADCLAITEKLGIYGSSKMDNFIAGVTQRASQAEKDGNFFKKTNDGLEFTDTATFASYMQMIKDLTDAGSYPDAGAIKEIKDIEGDYLVTEDAAMTWVSSNQIASIVNAAGREIKIAPVPRITKDGSYGMGVQSSQQLCMAKSSKNKEEAAKFINYFVNDIEANKVLNGERGVPIMSKVRDVVMEQADDSSKMIYDFVDKIGNFPKEDCNVISPDPKTEIEDQYKLLIEKVQYGDVTPEDAARQLVEFAESKFTRQQ